MKIDRIEVQNFLRIKDFSGDLSPLTIFSGKNGAGKSSLRDGLIFAFTGDPGRAGRQTKTSKELVHRGAEGGSVCVHYDGDKSITRDVGSGALLGPKAEFPAALPFVLRAEDFAKDTTDRRSVLFNVMKLSAGAEEILKRLKEKKIDQGVVDEVKHLLAGGCPPAHTEAEKKRTLAKGQWHEATGEVYGSKKGETWKAPSPGYDAQELAEVTEDITAWNQIIAQQNQLIGEFNAHNNAQAQLPALKEKAKTHAAEAAALKKLREQYKALQDELEKLPAPGKPAQSSLAGMGAGAAAKQPTPLVQQVMECPDCKVKLVYQAGKLAHAPKAAEAAPEPAKAEAKAKPASTAETPQEDPNKARRAQITADMAPLAQQIAVAEKRVAEADAAAAQADQLEKAEARPELAGAAEKLADAQAGLAECEQIAADLKVAKVATEAAESKTKRAQELHVKIVNWEALVAALSPDGIPADILKSALGPLDAELELAAEQTQWGRVRLSETDMSVSFAGFPYKLCSESHKWRADVMLAVAIAKISGINLVLVDRMDVCDMQGRGEFINWCYDLNDAGVQVICFATLKAKPELEGAAVFWLGDAEVAA